ncbi:component of SufBCD complex [Aliiroseovarius marinus]|uniref:component of SufBCD complex n=1 Tax=Aliiroseovarius marinus TaxID=2500159 RepID=UPI002492A444|nr:component of SufBCD complex [Aliiroseovarius marinus]
MRSFSNLWYWIGLAVAWSMASYWVVGVPYDMIQRAGRVEGEALEDLETIVRVNCNRITSLSDQSGMSLIAVASAVLSSLAILGFWYSVEFAQAVFLLMFPMVFVGLLSVRSAITIQSQALEGEALRRFLLRHRLMVQLIGMLAILITALWGMYHNLAYSVLR